MMLKNKNLLLMVFVVAALLLAACGAKVGGADGVAIESPEPAAEGPSSQIIEEEPEAKEPVVRPTQIVDVDSDQDAQETETEVDNEPAPQATGFFEQYAGEEWVQMQVGGDSKPVMIDGVLWELVLASHYAKDLSGGRYGYKDPLPSSPELGYCGEGQQDCPSHYLLIRVETLAKYEACLSALLTISYRLELDPTDCGGEIVPVRVSLRPNDQTLTSEEAKKAYLSLADLESFVSGIQSHVGAFFGSKLPSDTVRAQVDAWEDRIGYSCWDCLADTEGPVKEDPVPLDDSISTFGPDTAPLGNGLFVGRVVPLEYKEGKVDVTVIKMASADPSMLWISRYDVAN